MQTMGSRPAAAMAASALARTAASVSPQPARRSEWPTITSVAPASASIAALTSPVKAPEGSALQVCPPISTTDPFSACAMRQIRVAGGQSATRAVGRLLGQVRGQRLGLRGAGARSAPRPFIFQFPAMNGAGIGDPQSAQKRAFVVAPESHR